MPPWHFHCSRRFARAGLLAGDARGRRRPASAPAWAGNTGGWPVTQDRPPSPDLRVLLGLAALTMVLLAFAPPCHGGQLEISLELYVYPLKTIPVPSAEVAGFLSPERATALGKQLLTAQPLLTSNVEFTLPDDAVVDAPIPCASQPGARLGSPRARVILQLEHQEISLSGSIFLQPEDASTPFLRSFSAHFPRNPGYTYCIRGMFFIVSDRLLEGIALIRAGSPLDDPVRTKRPVPRLPLEPSSAPKHPEPEWHP